MRGKNPIRMGSCCAGTCRHLCRDVVHLAILENFARRANVTVCAAIDSVDAGAAVEHIIGRPAANSVITIAAEAYVTALPARQNVVA